jgi:hypothetical protein
MENIVKDENSIINQSKNSSGGFDYVLKNGTWLGDSFNFLPSGIIDKRETGIGATTLEIKCNRDSIIIEPLKSTVKQKTDGKDDIFPYLVENLSVSEDLTNYLQRHQHKPKKIMLVIDNLERLINDLGDNILEYFLLFDEIDFMQGSSSYRQRMELGLDIGKSHGNFALVSATVIEFSDPELKNIPRTSFTYESIDKIPVRINHYSKVTQGVQAKKNNLLNELNSYIIYNLQQNQQDKLLIALNSVSLIEKISNSLVNKGYITQDEITLLISDNKYSNRALKEKFSNKEIQNKKLPTRLNFITSAYFNGYDLDDTYRLAIFTAPPFGNLMLTMNEIRQIYGRNRIKNGITEFILFSHDCLIEDIDDNEFLDFTVNDWLEFAHVQVDMSNCIDKHFKKKYESGVKQKATQLFYSKFTEDLGKNKYVLSRRKGNINREKFSHSILNKDFTAKQNTIAYYQIDYLHYRYHNLKSIYINNSVLEINNEPVYIENITGIVETLENNNFEIIYDNGQKEWKSEKIEKITISQKEEIAGIIDFFRTKKDFDLKMLDRKQLLVYDIINLARKQYSEKSTIKQILELHSFDKLNRLKEFLVLKSDLNSNILIRQIKYHIKNNSKLTSAEIIDMVKAVFEDLEKPMPKKFSFKYARDIVSLVYALESKKFRNSEGKTVSGYIFTNAKPFKALKKIKLN